MAEAIDDILNRLESAETPTQSNQNINDILSRLENKEAPESKSAFDEYFEKAKQLGQKVNRGAELLTRGAAQTIPSSIAGFAAGGPVGGMIGSVAIPFGDTLNSIINRVAGTNLRMPSEIISTNLAKAGLAEPKSPEARAVEAAGTGLGGAASELGSMYGLAKSTASPVLKEIGEAFTNKAGHQLATAPVAAGAGQYVGEKTGSPAAGLATSLGLGATAGISPMRKATSAPTAEDLINESKNLYAKAKEAGVQFDTKKFADSMFQIGSNLRQEGYTKGAYPGIGSVLEEMTNVQNPKDFTELQAIRKMIQGQQKSADPETRRLASIVKDDFDEYLLNAPSDHITTGNPNGMKLWSDARNSYSRLKKSEIFDDMLQNAEVDKSKFTQSGAENSMAQQLRQLAKNDKKMRMFTSEEQDAIRKAATGGNAQQLLKFFGRFAPTGPVTGIFTGEMSARLPVIGPALSAGAIAARGGAEAIRRNAIENLGAQMRLGQKPQLSPIYNPTQSFIAAPPVSGYSYLNDLVKEQK